ncbi:MAG: PD-(D/E)XK nuclease family protein, partial [Bacteroidales bacterium]|nr:PD-(D/E)XK nuclease family protein [Bacteroidales bacterium]
TTIYDYKTGKVDTKELKFSDSKELFENEELSKLFQLMMYAYLFRNDQTTQQFEKDSVTCAIVSFQALNKSGNPNIIPTHGSKEKNEIDGFLISDDMLFEFENQLINVLQQITNCDIPFIQTEEYRNCGFCDYKNFCGR